VSFCWYVASVSASGNLRFGSTTGNWSEMSVTWNNRPGSTHVVDIAVSSTGWYCAHSRSSSTASNIFRSNLWGERYGYYFFAGSMNSFTVNSREATLNKPYWNGTYSYAILSSIQVFTHNATAYRLVFRMSKLPSGLESRIWIEYNVTHTNGTRLQTNARATYNSTGKTWYGIVRSDAFVDGIRLLYKGYTYHTYRWRIFPPSPYEMSWLAPPPGSVLYSSNVNVSFTLPLNEGANLSVIAANGTKRNVSVTGSLRLSRTLKLAEGRNFIRLIYRSTGRYYYSELYDFVIDEYLPSMPSISRPSNNANLTYNVLNLSWTHDGFDVENFVLKAWRNYPTAWALSQVVPRSSRWSWIALAGSGTYYLQVVARDAAGNERASPPITVNVAASDVIVTNLTLNMTGFTVRMRNTVNSSRDAFWNITLTLLEGSRVEYRQGSLSFYPNESKELSIKWYRNLTPNVYLASLWVRDSFGKQTGYLRSFIAMPPIQQVSSVPLSVAIGPWESEVVGLNESVVLSNVVVIANSNPSESTMQKVSLPLPNISFSALSVKNRITGAEYQVNFNKYVANVTVPPIQPYSSLILGMRGTTADRVNAYFYDTQEPPVYIGNSYWRPLNLTIVNKVGIDVRVRLQENATLKIECPQCSLSGGTMLLSLKPNEGVYLRAYKLAPANLTRDLMRPLSTALNFMSTTTTGVLIALALGVLLPVAAIVRWEARRRW
ncbi:MAG: hypothetical protein RMJ06_06850, partial [Nitrososphaerota archaeon]|nr:hypothetical protein [Nitrososphaerota archaeon]